MKHERYIINDAEIALLDKYEGTVSQTKDPHRYNTFDKESLAAFCKMKDRSNDKKCDDKRKQKQALQERAQKRGQALLFGARPPKGTPQPLPISRA